MQGGDPLSVVDLGIVHLAPGRRPRSRSAQTSTTLLDDRVLRRSPASEFRNQEVEFWDNSTPIGIIFTAGKIIGFIVGMVICYQVIYSDIADHMPEFATLKAMGYSTWYFLRLIVDGGRAAVVHRLRPGRDRQHGAVRRAGQRHGPAAADDAAIDGFCARADDRDVHRLGTAGRAQAAGRRSGEFVLECAIARKCEFEC